MIRGLENSDFVSKIIEMLGIRRKQFRSDQEYWFAKSAFLYTNIGMIVAFGYSLFYLMIGAGYAALSLGLLGILLIGTTPLHYLGKSWLLSKINLAATSFALAGVVVHTGGINSSGACWLLGVTPGITALLFRRASAIIQLTLLTILLYCGIFAAEMAGYPVQQLGYPVGSVFERIYTFIHYASFSIFIAMALSIFAITQKNLYGKLEINKEKLEKTTMNLKAIFDTIHQAVFLINDNLEISQERSAQFQDILGADTHDLRQILSRCQISSDQRAQILEVIKSSIGESSLNFFSNEHHLPATLHFQRNPETSPVILSVQWSPIFRAQDVRDILVTMRDITALEQVKEKARQADDRNSLLLVLLQTPAALLQLTIESFDRLEQRLSQILQSGIDDSTAFKSLIHTIKGNARSKQIAILADYCHEIESRFEQITRSGERVQSIVPMCQELAEKMREFIEVYKTTLGRKTDTGDIIKVEREFLKGAVARLIQLDGIPDVVAHFQTLMQTNLSNLLASLSLDIENLSRELGKPMPTIELDEQGIHFPEDYSHLLLNALGHLVRNALDHGIEDPASRMRSGKSPQGHIGFTIEQNEGFYRLRMHDDGCGLHLERIRREAYRKGLAFNSDEEAAEMIFREDFSTREKISIISGRGVGLSSVRHDLQKMYGDVKIHFSGPEINGFRCFAFELNWPEQLTQEQERLLQAAV